MSGFQRSLSAPEMNQTARGVFGGSMRLNWRVWRRQNWVCDRVASEECAWNSNMSRFQSCPTEAARYER